jgi:flagellar hook-basal body complex protein FliE
MYANQLIDKYLKGEVELQDVMVVQSKMSIMVQLAITTINTAVNTFKEITQIQV